MLNIAIDYDNTFTADSFLFIKIIELMQSRGHRVIIATGRHRWSEDMERTPLPPDLDVVYCGVELKSIACKRAGYNVDIWIDDTPSTISPQLLISDDDGL